MAGKVGEVPFAELAANKEQMMVKSVSDEKLDADWLTDFDHGVIDRMCERPCNTEDLAPDEAAEYRRGYQIAGRMIGSAT